MVTPLVATRAYAGVQGALSGGGGLGAAATGATSGGGASGPNFSDLVQSAVSDAVQSSRHAERMMSAQVQGKADLLDVVTAISSAEANLQTMVSVRDQVISAYQEIMRMPI
jgi:flagellar hook-basal body complex protein FliE